MDCDPRVEGCITSFLRRDYVGCGRLAWGMLQRGIEPVTLRLLLICLLRTGQEEWVGNIGSQALTATEGDPWLHTLIRLTLGEVSGEEVQAVAATQEEQCQAAFYWGARLLTEDRREEAAEAFITARRIGIPCVERTLAVGELADAVGHDSPSTCAEEYKRLVALNRHVDQLYSRGDLEGAFNPAAEARELSRCFGVTHPERTTAANFLGLLQRARQNYAAAAELFRECLEARLEIEGELHPDTATSLNNLGAVLQDQGRYDEGEGFYLRALTAYRATYGEHHRLVAETLHNLGTLYSRTGDHARAEEHFQGALLSHRGALGGDHPTLILPLLGLLGARLDRGDHRGAEDVLHEALALGAADHPEIDAALGRLGTARYERGQFARAEEFYRSAFNAARRARVGSDPTTIRWLRCAGQSLLILGELKAACDDLQGALRLARDGGRAVETAPCLIALARLETEQGDFARAESLLRESLGLLESVTGSTGGVSSVTHTRGALKAGPGDGEAYKLLAITLNALGAVCNCQGNVAEGSLHLANAVSLSEAVYGSDHCDTASAMVNLASHFVITCQYELAEPRLWSAVEIYRRAVGSGHPLLATALEHLARFYLQTGRPGRAEPLLREALEINRAAFGARHESVGAVQRALATVLARVGDRLAEMLPLLLEAALTEDEAIGRALAVRSERQQRLNLELRWSALAEQLSLIRLHFREDRAAVAASFDLVLRRKSIGAEAASTLRRETLGGRYPSLRELLDEWRVLREQIARLSLDGMSGESAQVEWDRLVAERDRVEAALVREIPELNLTHRLRAADYRAVAAALPEGSVLLEYVRIPDADLLPTFAATGTPRKRYLVFLLPARHPEQIRLIDLGDTEAVDRLVASFRIATVGTPDRSGGRNLTLVEARSDESPSTVEGIELRSAVFDPAAALIDLGATVFLAPDGDLNRLPFEALPGRQRGSHLIDEYRICYLTTGRDVLRFGRPSSGVPSAPLVVADPDFDLGGAAGPGDHTEPAGAVAFTRLPGARSEGEEVAAILNAELLASSDATKAQLMARRAPRILHIATHGFFLPAPEPLPDQQRRFMNIQTDWGWIHTANPPLRSRRASPATPPDEAGTRERLGGWGMDDPMLRSGLALAGANAWLRRGELPEGVGDGLLTAADVTGMDLLDTDLVVLSACQTGLGEARLGDGVYGLRRAFTLAGARTLVMSLWKVPDAETRELMADFYHRLGSGESVSDALRGAQLAPRAKQSDPFVWGAFVCQGDPGQVAIGPVNEPCGGPVESARE